VKVYQNPLYPPFHQLCVRTNAAWGLFCFVEGRVRGWQEKWAEAESRVKRDALLAAHRLPCSDITGEHDNGWRISFPVPDGFVITIDELDGSADDMVGLNAGWTVSQAYEAHETFLFDVAASYLHTSQSVVDKKCREKYENSRLYVGASETEVAYWNGLVRYSYRGDNNKKIRSFLRSQAPTLAAAESSNDRRVDLVAWYKAISTVRHAATHVGGFIRDDDIAGQPIQDFGQWFPIARDEEKSGYWLKLTKQKAELALRLLIEYGYQIFKALSQVIDGEWDLRGPGQKR